MHIQKLKLLNFRSHCNLHMNDIGSFVQIIGPNGSGKTNILEAISLLSPGRGLHQRQFDEMLSTNQSIYKDWSVRADFNDDRHISTGAVVTDAAAKRISYIDGEKVRNQGELLQVLRVIWLTPQMDDLFIAPAASRRRFLDRLTYNFHPEHAANVAKYEYFMRSRLKLLIHGNHNQAWLNQMEGKMAEYALALFEARTKALEIIKATLQEEQRHFISPILQLDNGHHEITLEEITKLLHDNRAMDASRGRSHFGPHKSDLIAIHPAKQLAASQCSTGEQKAMLVALMLSQAKGIKKHCQHPPIVLLDELFTHLDHTVQQHLLEALQGFAAQTWTTSTEYQFGLPDETVLKLGQ